MFFSASTHRWSILLKNVSVSVKRLSVTRWSSHFEAVKPVFNCFEKIVEAIEAMCDASETIETRGAAQILLPAICDFSFLSFLCLWREILEEVDDAQKYLQIRGLCFEKAVFKMKSLKLFLKDRRDDLVEKALNFGKETCEEMGIPIIKRRNYRKKKTMPGEMADDEPLSIEKEIKRSMLECLDRFSLEISTRCEAMEAISERFAILQPKNLLEVPEKELSALVVSLAEFYNEFSPAENLIREVLRLRRFLDSSGIPNEESHNWTSLKFLQFIVENELLDSLPNLTLAFRFFLTLCVSVASCERSFSKLKLIKSYLRSTMNQARLSSLAILSIENGIAEQIDFDDAITKFAGLKMRRKRF